MPLSEQDVCKIAEYVRIGLSDAEIASMTVDLNNIIETLKPITEYDLTGIEPTFHPIGDLSNVMREDTTGASMSRAAALGNSDSVRDGRFEIPTILGGEGDR